MSVFNLQAPVGGQYVQWHAWHVPHHIEVDGGGWRQMVCNAGLDCHWHLGGGRAVVKLRLEFRDLFSVN